MSSPFIAPIIANSRICVIDCEATSVIQTTSELLQIALVQVDYGKVGIRAQVHIKPRKPIPPASTAIHGITDARVARSRAFNEVAGDIVGIIGERILLGYNVASFDYPMLRRNLRNLGVDEWERSVIDLFPIMKRLDPNKTKTKGYHKLGTVARRHGIDPGREHDAFDDVRTAWQLFELLAANHPEIANMTPPTIAPVPSPARAQADLDEELRHEDEDAE